VATQTTFDEPLAVPLASVSGARFRSLRPFLAMELFERLGGCVDRSLVEGEAWGAFEERTELIGACALVPVSTESFRVQVSVLPERRRLGIGAELLHLAAVQVRRRGARILMGSHAADAVDARMLVATLGTSTARRVRRGWADVVLLLPPTTPTEEATR
jgi:GNAT superfamily N-acetyltransferase